MNTRPSSVTDTFFVQGLGHVRSFTMGRNQTPNNPSVKNGAAHLHCEYLAAGKCREVAMLQEARDDVSDRQHGFSGLDMAGFCSL